jgi:hypothetical protein
MEGQAVKRLALLALLLTSSSVVAAPAPLPKPQRKAEPPPPKKVLRYELPLSGDLDVLVLPPAQPARLCRRRFPPSRPTPTRPADRCPPLIN